MMKPAAVRSDLETLIAKAKADWNAGKRMSTEGAREQRISFVYGQMMDCATSVTRDEVEAAHDQMYGSNKGDGK